MKKYSMPLDQLKAMPSAELMHKINYENISLLKSLGAEKMRREMLPIGFVCRFLVNWACICKDDSKLKTRVCRILGSVAPFKLLREFPRFEGAVVSGFNHPSLGELFRLVYLGLHTYPDREFLFPVNLPWYESLTPAIPKLERIGITIVPMITPSSEKKLRTMFEGNEEMLGYVQHFKVLLERRYMRAAREAAARKEVIFLAPSATRQATVFETPEAARGEGHIHPTMTILAHMLLKDPDADVSFLPVTVFEPKRGDRKLNLFKIYKIYPCDAFSAAEARELAEGQSRSFDYLFLKRIDEQYNSVVK